MSWRTRIVVLVAAVGALALLGCKSKSEEGGEESEKEKSAEGEGAGSDEGGGGSDEGEGGSGKTKTTEAEPSEPTEETKVAHITVGNEVSCALRADDSVMCWGLNEDNILAMEDETIDAVVPQIVTKVEDVEALWVGESNSVGGGGMYGTGAYNSACARTSDGTVKCWGHDEGAVFHGGDQPDDGATPVEVKELANAVDIDFGGGTSCAALKDGKAVCWGSNAFKTLGREADKSQEVSHGTYGIGAVEGIDGKVVDVESGLNHTCARTEKGDLWCWGEKKAAAKISEETFKTPIADLSATTKQGYTCLVDSGKNVVCSTRDFSGFKPVKGVSNAAEVSVGTHDTCARDEAGKVWCWCTSDDWSALGCEKENTPVEVTLPEPATQIDVDRSHACALLESGKMACWGQNRRGQLGDGTITDRAEPVLVAGLGADSTEVPDLPASAELPPIKWPGEGLELCKDTKVEGEETFTPRTVRVTPERTREGNWRLGFVLTEDIVENEKRKPRPRGRGVLLDIWLDAQKEIQRSPGGDEIAYESQPLAAGKFEAEGENIVTGKAMNRIDDIRLDKPVVELTQIDMEKGIVCGTVTAGVQDSDQKIAGRFGAKIAPEKLEAAALIEESKPLEPKPMKLASGDELKAATCDVGELDTVSHAGESPFEAFATDDKRMIIDAGRNQLAVLDINERKADACKLTLASGVGVDGYLLPDDKPRQMVLDGSGKLLGKGAFDRVYSYGDDSTAEEMCKIEDLEAVAASSDGTLLAVTENPPFTLRDGATCEEKAKIELEEKYKECGAAAFVDKKTFAVRCEEDGVRKVVVVDTKGNVKWSAGSKDYSSPEQLGYSAQVVGACGDSICAIDGDELKVWKSDGSFAGEVDLGETLGAKEIHGVHGDADGVWVLAAAPRAEESTSWEAHVMRLTGFP